MVVLVSDDDAVDQMLTKQRGRFRQGSIGGACDQPFVHELANGAHWKPAQIGVVTFNGKMMNTMPEWRRHVPIAVPVMLSSYLSQDLSPGVLDRFAKTL